MRLSLHAILAPAVALVAFLWPAPAAAAPGDLPPGFQEATLLEGLLDPATFDFAPDGRIFFTERVAGHLRVAVESPAGSGSWQVEASPFASFDIPKENGAPAAHRSSGVRGFAFDPAFGTNGYVYVFYMKDNPRQNRVVRIQRDPQNPNRSLPGETLLIELPFNSSSASGSHNGGALRFGPDGMLYITTGDGWTGGDGVQSLSTFTGKVLRIRPDGSIPSDNPFYSQASGSYRSIYALGLRNPYTLTRGPGGRMLIGEANGANKANLLALEAGANFRHQGYASIGTSRGRWADAAAAGNKMVSGGAWYPASGPFPSSYHGAYFVALWGTNGADGGPPGQISYVRSATDTTVSAFDTNVGQFDGAGTRLKPVHLRVGPDGALYYLMTSYMTGAGSIVRVGYGQSNTVSTPTFSPAGGTYGAEVNVSIASTTSGATVRYTVDGSEPTASSQPFTSPLLINRDATLRARAFTQSGESAIATADYVIGGAPNVPPIVNAGPNQTAEPRTRVVLNGAATRDPDGSALQLSETWTQVSGPTTEVYNSDETAAFFFPTEVGRYRFQLEVTDGFDSSTDTTLVHVLPCVNDVRLDLVGRWSFEEESGDVAVDSASGLWNGLLEGPSRSDEGVTVHSASRRKGALDFDGSADSVLLGAPDVSGNALTICAWIRPDDFGVSDARIVSKATGVSEGDHYWMLSTVPQGSETRLRFRLKAGGSTATLIAGAGALSPGQWAFVAAVYDGQRMRLFVDGAEVGSRAKSGAIATSPNVPAAIGNQPQGARAFDGLIDEVRIYSRGLEPFELDIVAGRTRRVDCLPEATPR